MDADCIFSSDVSFLSLQPRQSNVHKGFTGVPAAANQTPGIPTAEFHSICSCLRWAPLTSSSHQHRGSPRAHRSCPWHLKPLCCPWGYHNSGSHCSVHESVCEPLRLIVLRGRKGDRVAETFRAPSHFCHSSFWSLNSFLLPLNLVSVLKRAADSSHQSFNEISQFEALLLG